LFRHKRQDGKEYIKVGYHEGLVASETWLAVQDKKSHNQRIPNNSGAKNSWLVGLTKCANCGHSFVILYKWNKAQTIQWRYYGDTGFYRANSCIKRRLKIRPDAVEQVVYNAMKERLATLEIARTEKAKPDTETENLKAEIIRVEDEIRGLMDKLAQADDVLFDYIQERVKTLHAKKSELDEKLRTKARKHQEIDTAPLIDPLSRWDTLTTEEKHELAVTMIDVVYISDENGVDINFSI
jgi:hypothetical protein